MPGDGELNQPGGDPGAISNLPGGEPAGGKPGASGEPRIPDELMPAFNAKLQAERDAIREAAVKRARKEWETEVAEKQKLADMTEVERVKAEHTKLQAQLEHERGEREYLKATIAVRNEVTKLGYVPEYCLDHYMAKALEDDPDKFDPASVAKAAYDAFEADRKYGTQPATTLRRPAGIPGGTQPLNGGTDFTKRTTEDVQAEIRRLARAGKLKESQQLLNDWKASVATGARTQ